MGKFLRILMYCHGRADRSFFLCGKQLPICARCTGELIGILIGIPIVFFTGRIRVSAMLLLMLPMVIDGFLQLLTLYESKNYKRLLTGILFGFAFVSFLVYFHRTCVMIAGAMIKLFVQDTDKVNQAMELFL